MQQLQGKHTDNQTCQALLQAQGLEQFVVGEADAKMMRTHLGSRVAYNVQSAVDTERCLILHHEVTQDGGDNQQLEPMAKANQTVLQQDRLEVIADAGYSNGAQFQACEEAGITAYVPPNRAANSQGDGQHFDRSAFIYDAQHDHYHYPAGQVLALKQLNRGHRLYAANAQRLCGLPAEIAVHPSQAALSDAPCP